MKPPELSLDPPFELRDPRGMAALVDAIADHIEQALARTDAAPWEVPAGAHEFLAVGGMGGSAIAAELTAAAFADQMPRPLLVCRDYRWPACVTPRGLVLLSSNSGNTEETLALEAQARAMHVPTVTMASGGELGERAAKSGVHRQHVPSGMPPHAALFHAWVPMTRLVHALGWVADPAPAWREAAAVLRERMGILGTTVPETQNLAKQLARRLAGRTVFVYSAAGPTSAVGTRIRQQLNENAKLFAHCAVVPELNHNEIVGWQQAGPAQKLSVLVLRDREDPVEAKTRLDLTARYAVRQGADVHEITSIGESRLARLASLVQFGDHLSVYLALLGGVDPTDITSIDDFKRRLAEHKARS